LNSQIHFVSSDAMTFIVILWVYVSKTPIQTDPARI